jgi:hypothetical protein
MQEQKKRGKAQFWKDFESVIEMKGGERLCWLKCSMVVSFPFERL